MTTKIIDRVLIAKHKCLTGSCPGQADTCIRMHGKTTDGRPVEVDRWVCHACAKADTLKPKRKARKKWDQVAYLVTILAESDIPIRPRGRSGWNHEAEHWVGHWGPSDMSAQIRNQVIAAANGRRILERFKKS